MTTELFLRWKAQRPGAANRQTWSYRLSHVRTFARWLHSLEPRTVVPPPGLVPQNRRRPQPYIYTDEEVADIVAGAARLPSRHGLRGPTYMALFGLLAVTGLRVGEAVALDNVDVDTDEATLHVRHAKNNQNRTVPITSCTAERLACYRSLRDRTLRAPDTPAFFRAEHGQRITKASAEHNFARVGQETGPARAPAFGSSRNGSPPARPAPHHGRPHPRRLVPVRPRPGPRDVQAERMARSRQSRRDVLVPRGGARASPSGHRAGGASDHGRETS